MRKLIWIVALGFLLLVVMAAFAQQPPAVSEPVTRAGRVDPTPKADDRARPPEPPLPAVTPVAADSELLLIFQAHRVTSQLIDEKLKTAGIPELQQEIRVLQARFEAWKKAKNVPAGWIWNDVAKQFEKPPAAPSTPLGTSKPEAEKR